MACVRLQLSNTALVRSVSAKSVSCNCEFLKTVFLILVLKNEEWFSWQPSNEKESPNSLQVSNRSPNILQSLNFMSRKAVLFSFVKLKLQPLNVQSVNLNSERSLSEKLQLLKIQFSYSPFVSVSFRSKVLSCMYVSSICLFCHLERCPVTLATNIILAKVLNLGGLNINKHNEFFLQIRYLILFYLNYICHKILNLNYGN